MVDLCLIFLVLVSSGNCLKMQKGKQFMLPFMDVGDSVRLMIITEFATNVTITNPNLSIALSLAPTTVHNEYILVEKVGYTGAFSTVSKKKALSVNATEEVWLYVFCGINGTDEAGYMAIPTDLLGHNYTVVTYNANRVQSYYSFFVVAAVEDETTVGIYMKTKINTQCESANMSNHDIMVTTMNKGEVIGFICREDLTGTLINSDKAIAVVSGHECAVVSGSSTNANYCNLLVEMIIPLESFGSNYVLSNPDLNAGVIYRVVAPPEGNTTVISSSAGVGGTMGPSDFMDIDTSATGAITITTSHPCLVVALTICECPSYYDVNFGSDMAIVPSTDRYLSKYIMENSLYKVAFGENDIVSIVFEMTHSIKGVDNSSTVILKDTTFSPLTLNVTNLVDLNLDSANVTRSMILYGQSPDGSSVVSFPLGMLLGANYCATTPCFNNATCIDLKQTFNCTCRPGYQGTLCETDIDECASNPCHNNASCQNQVNKFVCECQPGFDGTLCKIDIDECASSPCHNNASCRNLVNKFVCECQPGFDGTLCKIDINECDVTGTTSPCYNGGTCQDSIGHFRCHCPAGYSGDTCEIDIDECVGSLCENGATCVDMINAYECVCSQGYIGSMCELDIDECGVSGSINPCYNGGTCENLPGYFRCHCPSGYTGDLCTNTLPALQSSESMHSSQEYSITRIIQVGTYILTSSGTTNAFTDLQTGVRYTTSYTTPLLLHETVSGSFVEYEYQCICTRYGNSTGRKPDAEQLASRLRRTLLVDKDTLRKTVTKHISVQDDRPVSKGLGGLGVAIIIGSMLLIAVPDVFYFLRMLDAPNVKRPGHP